MEKRRGLNVVLVGLILVVIYYGIMSWIWYTWQPSKEFFLNLNFLGYGLLGIAVGYIGRKNFATSFLMGFVVGFLGTLISSVSYGDFRLDKISRLIYEFSIYGITMGIGALIGVFFTRMRKREASPSSI